MFTRNLIPSLFHFALEKSRTFLIRLKASFIIKQRIQASSINKWKQSMHFETLHQLPSTQFTKINGNQAHQGQNSDENEPPREKMLFIAMKMAYQHQINNPKHQPRKKRCLQSYDQGLIKHQQTSRPQISTQKGSKTQEDLQMDLHKFYCLNWTYNINAMQAPKSLEVGEGKRNYSKIPIKKRMLLVKLVLKKGVPIGEAIEQLGLKITTARFIINKYKETGTFPRRKFKKRSIKAKDSRECKEEFESQPNESISEPEAREEERTVKVEEVEGVCGVKVEEEDRRMLWVYYPWFML